MVECKRLIGIAFIVAFIATSVPFFERPSLAAGPDGWREEFSAGLARQLDKIYQETQTLTPAQRKIDSRVLNVVREARTRASVMAKGDIPRVQDLTTPLLRIDAAGDIEVKLTVSHVDTDQVQQLETLGMKVVQTLPEYGIIEGTIPFEQVEAVAALDFVINLTTPGYAWHSAGSVSSEGDAVTRAAEARTTFSINGTGVKVGVISDGVDYLSASVASGDLPTSPVVQVLKAGGGNEGTAMLEIVHDLAPGASLAFYGPDTSTDMVTGIRSLKNAGSKIIVDDLVFFDELKFEDGPIALETRAFYNGGGVYVTAAGNDAERHYRANYTRAAGPGGSYPYAHDYGGGDIGNSFVLPAGAPIFTIFQWNNRSGQSGDNFDIFLVRSDVSPPVVLAGSTNYQDGNDTAWEGFSYTNTTGSNIIVSIEVFERWLVSSPSSLVLDYIVYNAPWLQYVEPADSVIGHSAVTEVLSTATVNADTPTEIAYYSSRGPGTIYFPTYEERQLPNITGVDGVSTRTGELGYFNNPFYGTSAAAPHVAAIAALMWQAQPALVSSWLRQTILTTAVDRGPPGWDSTWGFGSIDAYEAIASGISAPPTVATGNATDTAAFSAQLHGNLGRLGLAASAEVSFQWGLGSGNYTQTTPAVSMNTTGNFTANISGMVPNTTYFFRARAISSGITVYGQQASFTTLRYPWEWVRIHGGAGNDVAYGVVPSSDGGYIITGKTDSPEMGPGGVYLANIDIDGDLVWTQTFGTSVDQVYSIERAKDSGYILVGSTHNDIYLVKAAATGNLTWQKTFGMGSGVIARSVQPTTDGGYIIAGSAGGDFILIKTDTSGNLTWQMTFNGGYTEESRSVKQTADGGYIIVGSTGYSPPGSAGDYNVYLVKTDASGNMTWSQTFGGPYEERGYSVWQTADGGYIIGGYTYGGGTIGAYLVKTNSSGNMTWSRLLGTSLQAEGFSLLPTTDGGYLIAGVTYGADSNAYVVKTNSSGYAIWEKTFGITGTNQQERAYSVQQSWDGGYIVAGETYYYAPFGSQSPSDIYLVKIPPETSAPALTTEDATSVTGTSVTLRGNLTALGLAFSANVTFQWGTSSGTYTHETTPQVFSSIGTFSANLTGLTRTTSYYFRAKSVGNGTSYGEEKSFTTTPSVFTGSAANVSGSAAILRGLVDTLGTAPFANISFQWGLTSSDYLFETAPLLTNDKGSFSTRITGLSANTTYYFRAKVISDTTSYGNEMSFTSAAIPQFLFAWGTTDNGDGQFLDPLSIAIDSLNNIFVTERSNNRIQKFDSSGQLLTKWGSYGYNDDQFLIPTSVAVNSAGDVHVAEALSNRLKVFTSAGQLIGWWYTGGYSNSSGVAVDSSGNVYVVNTGVNRIQKFNSSGQLITQWGTWGGGDGQFYEPLGVAVDSAGNVYVSEYYNHRIQKFTSSGQFITKWGTSGTGDGQFRAPHSLAIDSEGNIYVADTFNHRIQKFTSSGEFITKWGTLGSGEGQLAEPSGVAVDSLGNVYVADTKNNRIQVFTQSVPPGVITTNADNISDTSAWLTGYFTGLGTTASANVSFQWGTSSLNYTYETAPVSMNATGAFNTELAGLSANTTYYFRAKAAGDGVGYGEEKSFKIAATLLPGDVNGDDTIDAIDITKLERIIVHLDASTVGADANQDGFIDAIDVTKVERIIVHLD